MSHKPTKCPQCDGAGKVMEYDMVGPLGLETCGRCLGDGKLKEPDATIGGGYRAYEG